MTSNKDVLRVGPLPYCPACGRAELRETDHVVDLSRVFDRWEELLSVTFSEESRKKYTAQHSRFVTLLQCPVCTFGIFDPPRAGDQSFYETVETSDYYTPGKWEFELAINDLRAFGAHHVIDVGCGSGHFLRELRRAEPGMQLAGNDLSGRQIKQLAEEGFDVYEGPPSAIRDRSGAFDVVCSFQTLEHLADPFEGLRILCDLVRPGGLLIVTTPDTAGPVRHYRDSHTAVPPHHVSLWSERAFRAALPRHGFEIEIVRIEPLEHYLWNFYVDPQWRDGIWPAHVFGPLGQRIGLNDPDQQRQLAIDTLRGLGETRLHGVPGHTVYVLARRTMSDLAP